MCLVLSANTPEASLEDFFKKYGRKKSYTFYKCLSPRVSGKGYCTLFRGAPVRPGSRITEDGYPAVYQSDGYDHLTCKWYKYPVIQGGGLHLFIDKRYACAITPTSTFKVTVKRKDLIAYGGFDDFGDPESVVVRSYKLSRFSTYHIVSRLLEKLGR